MTNQLSCFLFVFSCAAFNLLYPETAGAERMKQHTQTSVARRPSQADRKPKEQNSV
jgi:hypothetical protein